MRILQISRVWLRGIYRAKENGECSRIVFACIIIRTKNRNFLFWDFNATFPRWDSFCELIHNWNIIDRGNEDSWLKGWKMKFRKDGVETCSSDVHRMNYYRSSYTFISPLYLEKGGWKNYSNAPREIWARVE